MCCAENGGWVLVARGLVVVIELLFDFCTGPFRMGWEHGNSAGVARSFNGLESVDVAAFKAGKLCVLRSLRCAATQFGLKVSACVGKDVLFGVLFCVLWGIITFELSWK